MLIRIILIGVALIMLIRTGKQFSEKAIRLYECVGWMFFWLALAVVAIFPDTTSVLAAYVGVGRGSDLAVYSAIIVIFYLMFRLFVRLDRMERDLTKVVRAVALKGQDEKELK